MLKLKWIDFLILRLIMLYSSDSSGTPPTLRQLFGPGQLINEWLVKYEIGPPFSTPVNYSGEVQESVSRLRTVNLLEPAGRMVITKRGIAISRDLAHRPQEWPYSVPIVDRNILWPLATYVEV